MLSASGSKAFPEPRYVLKRKILKLFGASFYGYDSQERLAFYVHQKAFKLKEDIRVYADEEQTRELLVIHARSILDFSAAYDVYDPNTGETVGVLKRKGFGSLMFRDEWVVQDAQERDLAILIEDSLAMGLVRRLIVNLIPQNYDMLVDGRRVADFRQNFNPFSYHLNIDFSEDLQGRVDRRLGIAAAVLLAAIEGRQS